MVIGIICGAVAGVLVAIIGSVVGSNKKKKKKLQQQIDALNNQKQEQEEIESKVILSESSYVDENEFEQVDFKEFLNEDDDLNDPFEDDDEFYKSLAEKYAKKDEPEIKPKKKLDRDAEFEKFLDENAMSRKVVDKSLSKELQSLPPKIKALLIGNIFNRYED